MQEDKLSCFQQSEKEQSKPIKNDNQNIIIFSQQHCQQHQKLFFIVVTGSVESKPSRTYVSGRTIQGGQLWYPGMLRPWLGLRSSDENLKGFPISIKIKRFLISFATELMEILLEDMKVQENHCKWNEINLTSAPVRPLFFWVCYDSWTCVGTFLRHLARCFFCNTYGPNQPIWVALWNVKRSQLTLSILLFIFGHGKVNFGLTIEVSFWNNQPQIKSPHHLFSL